MPIVVPAPPSMPSSVVPISAPSSLPSAPVAAPVSLVEPSSLPKTDAQVLATTLPPPQAPIVPQMPTVIAGPSTPSTPFNSTSFYIDMDTAPALSPSLPVSPGYSRCSSEPPQMSDTVPRPRARSRSVSRTPSLPPSEDSRTDLKSLPVTVQTPGTTFTSPVNTHGRAISSPCVVTCPAPDTGAPTLAPPSVLGLRDIGRSTSAPVTPDGSDLVAVRPRIHMPYKHPSKHTSAALNSTQYTDLFLLEPHEYDSITDGELVRLYDRGVIDGRVLEQIVDASIRIQRACTVADRAVSIKTRRAMIRHALEE